MHILQQNAIAVALNRSLEAHWQGQDGATREYRTRPDAHTLTQLKKMYANLAGKENVVSVTIWEGRRRILHWQTEHDT